MGKFIVRATEPERKETRCLVYNQWHRRQHDLSMVDIDQVEMCVKCQKPIAFIELARDVGTNEITDKCAMITSYVAWKMHRPCFVLFYRVAPDESDILGVKVMQVRPNKGPVIEMTPGEWASYLRFLHADHLLVCPKASKKLRNEKAWEVRMSRRLVVEIEASETIPTEYSGDEVLIFAGAAADELMEVVFNSPLGDSEENQYDSLRNKVAESMEEVMKQWEKAPDVPLPVELVRRMTKAGIAVITGNNR
jgi:hypothetical protein